MPSVILDKGGIVGSARGTTCRKKMKSDYELQRGENQKTLSPVVVVSMTSDQMFAISAPGELKYEEKNEDLSQHRIRLNY